MPETAKGAVTTLRLPELLDDLPAVGAGRAESIAAYRALIARCREDLGEAFRAGVSAADLVAFRTGLIDKLLVRVWQQCLGEPSALALIAVGGYGRAELHPASDIDLLLLAPGNALLHRHSDALQAFVTLLWDIGLEVGHSTRTLGDCVSEARKDLTVITAMMEARLLSGPAELFQRFEQRINAPRLWPARQFCSAKVAEQAARYRVYGDTTYRLEPNVKESPGGLRDLQTILWIAKRLYHSGQIEALAEQGFLTTGEMHTLLASRDFLWQVRNGLHLLAGRKDDRLLLDRQVTLARIFGYTDQPHGPMAVEQFMSRYFRTVTQVMRLSEILLQALQEQLRVFGRNRVEPLTREFNLRDGYLAAVDEHVFMRRPAALLDLFLILARDPERIRGVAADTIRLIHHNLNLINDDYRRDPRNTEIFLTLLRAPRGVSHQLRRMHRYGVLDCYLPAFGAVTGQMQHDLFHVYTVDAHTLWVVRNARLYANPATCADMPGTHAMFRQLPKPELLYVAALFHDLGKGKGGDHSSIGARLVNEFCQLHRLADFDRELVTWLVRHHLLMSAVSQRQDINDPEVIARFIAQVPDQTHLDYLYLLTIADMRGTSPTLWNTWKATLLGNLYHAATRALLRDGQPLVNAVARIAHVRQEALALLPEEKLSPAQADDLWSALGEKYLLRFTPQEIVWHAKNLAMLNAAELSGSKILVATRNIPKSGGTNVMIFTRDREGLFADITGVFDRLNLNIVDARLYTTPSGAALDTFMVLGPDDEPVTDAGRRREIRRALRRTLGQPAEQRELPSPGRRLPKQISAFRLTPEVAFFGSPEDGHTTLEVIATDRPGLLYRLARLLADEGVRILSARINTYGERVQDSFVISHRDGQALNDSSLLDRLQRQLMALLEVPDDNEPPDTSPGNRESTPPSVATHEAT